MDQESIKYYCGRQNVTSLEGQYTDFDQWVISFSRFYNKRPLTERERSQIPMAVKWQQLLVTGFQLNKKFKDGDIEKILGNDILNFDHIVLKFLNNGSIFYHHYTKSKL